MIGKRLAMARKAANMTQQELADLLGVTQKMVSNYERGENETDDRTKIIIAKALNVSVDYLLGLTDENVGLDKQKCIEVSDDFPKELVPEVKRYANILYSSYLFDKGR